MRLIRNRKGPFFDHRPIFLFPVVVALALVIGGQRIGVHINPDDEMIPVLAFPNAYDDLHPVNAGNGKYPLKMFFGCKGECMHIFHACGAFYNNQMFH